MGFIDDLRALNGQRQIGIKNILESNSKPCPAIRAEFEKLWSVYSDLADANFLSAFNSDPESRYWEMYLGASLRNYGIELSSSDSGPDLKVEGHTDPIWIEAIAPNQGDPDKPDYLPDKPEAGEVFDVPREKIILRFTSALETKRNKFAKYLEDGTVGPGDCCVIAVSAADLPFYPMEDSLPYIVQAVYPIGHQYVTFDKETLEVVDSGRHYQPFVLKAGEMNIPKFAFFAEEYNQISAVIFCAKGIGNTAENWGADLIVIHNATASVPLPSGIIGVGMEYSVEIEGEEGQLVWKDHNKS